MTVKEITECEDLNTLLLEHAIAHEKIGNIHKELKLTESDMDATELKGELGSTYSTIKIIDICIDRLRDFLAEEKREDNRVNYNFRLAARELLTKDAFETVMNLALKTRKEFKELKKNKQLRS